MDHHKLLVERVGFSYLRSFPVVVGVFLFIVVPLLVFLVLQVLQPLIQKLLNLFVVQGLHLLVIEVPLEHGSDNFLGRLQTIDFRPSSLAFL